MTDVLKVVKRETRGTKRMRRLRETGQTPAVLYGHGQENVMLSVPSNDLKSVVQHGHHFVTLSGDLSEDVLLKSVQWDAFGSTVLHVDFARVDKTEKVEVDVAIELKGTAAGEADGGMSEQLLHSVTIECPAAKVPDSIEVNINELALNASIHVSDLKLPAGAKAVNPGEDVVVHCVVPQAAPEAEAEGESASEPELISKPEAEDADE